MGNWLLEAQCFSILLKLELLLVEMTPEEGLRFCNKILAMKAAPAAEEE